VRCCRIVRAERGTLKAAHPAGRARPSSNVRRRRADDRANHVRRAAHLYLAHFEPRNATSPNRATCNGRANSITSARRMSGSSLRLQDVPCATLELEKLPNKFILKDRGFFQNLFRRSEKMGEPKCLCKEKFSPPQIDCFNCSSF